MHINIEVVWHALESVFIFFLIGCVGYFLAKRGWFSADSTNLLSKLITSVTLPFLMFHNISTVISHDELISLAYGIFPPFATLMVNLLISIPLVKLLKVRPNRRGICIVGFSFSNTIFIGLPVNMALFGEAALPFVLLYYFGNTLLFWTIGTYLLAKDGEGGKSVRMFSMDMAKRLFSPPLIGFFFGMLVLLLDIPIPNIIGETTRLLGSITTPLAVIFIGVIICNMGIRNIRINKELLFVACGRFIVSPLMVVALAYFYPLPDLMFKVFVIQSSLPAMTNIAILAGFYKSDLEFATVLVSATTLFALVSVPCYMALIS